MSSDEAGDENLHFVANADELSEGDRIITEISGREVAIFNIDGEYYATANYCIHQAGPIAEGMLSDFLTVNEEDELYFDSERKILACPWHAWEFDIKTGEHVTHSQYKIPTYDLVVRGDEIYVTF